MVRKKVMINSEKGIETLNLLLFLIIGDPL